uniref:N1970 protein n=1 Tax=Saccharomyces cerevisiae TaxID=4932 RepID=E9PAF9_YEASX|nr:N1970 [Saccharomyces cerevisiae]
MASCFTKFSSFCFNSSISLSTFSMPISILSISSCSNCLEYTQSSVLFEGNKFPGRLIKILKNSSFGSLNTISSKYTELTSASLLLWSVVFCSFPLSEFGTGLA